MPNIRTYDTPALGLQPSETGIQAVAGAANRIGRFYNQAAGAVKEVGDEEARGISSAIKDAGDVAVQYVDYQDRSKVSAKATQGLAGLEQQWQQTLKGVPDPNNPGKYIVPPADPNDPTVAQKFQEQQVQPFLESLQGVAIGENGQRYAQSKADEIRQHISNKMTADMSTLAGEAVVLNRVKTVNNLGNLVSTDPSFSTVDFALKQSRDDMDSHLGSPTLTADQTMKLKIHQAEDEQKIVHAAAISAISKSKDPEATANAFISKYPDLIKGDEANTFAKAATVQNKANILVSKQTELYQKQLDEAKVHKAANDVFNKNVTFDESTGRVTIKPQFFKDTLDVSKNNPDAPNAADVARTYINWGIEKQREKREMPVTDKETQTALYDGMFSPDKPTTEVDILKAANLGKLSDHDANNLLKLNKAMEEAPLKGPIYQGTMAAVKGIYGDGEMGHQAYANFLNDFIPQYLQKMRQGTLPPDALDTRNKNSLISKSLDQFRLSDKDLMADAFRKKFKGMSGDSIVDMMNPDAKRSDKNLTGAGKVDTGTEVINIPAGMSPAEAMKKYPGKTVKLPDGRMKVLPNG